MRAIVKSFEGLGRDEPDAYIPEDPFDDAFGLRMLVGPPDGLGEESFDVLVCTPNWLAKSVERRGPQVGRHKLILSMLDLELAQDFLRGEVAKLEAPTWLLLAEKIGRLGYWEFEDYQSSISI